MAPASSGVKEASRPLPQLGVIRMTVGALSEDPATGRKTD